MAASQTNLNGGSSSTFLHGELTAISAANDYLDGFIDMVEAAIDDAVSQSELGLQRQALMDQDWSTYASLLDVYAEDGELHYTHRGGIQDDYDIMSLEYGAFDTPPNPLLRSYAENDAANVANAISDHMTEENPFV